VNNPFFEYSTVTEALTDLRINKNAAISENDGWAIIKLVDGEMRSTWSFVAVSHSASPAVFRDAVVKVNDVIIFDHLTLCDAEISLLLSQDHLINVLSKPC
jgi:hypothetical protein